MKDNKYDSSQVMLRGKRSVIVKTGDTECTLE